MVHLTRMSQNGFFKKSSVFELYGLDFVMDDKFGLWFIEANTMPLVNGFTEGSTKLINKMMADMFEIIFGLLRSRMKRVVVYINKLTGEIRSGNNNLEISGLEQKREEFRKLTQNWFEEEFKPSPGNAFEKIVDENEYGVERYSGLLEEKCI